jgi:hypothetical protein
MDVTAILAILAQVDWVAVFTIVITILFFISEALGNIPQVKANSVYQLFIKFLKVIKDALNKKQNGKNQGQSKDEEEEDEDEEERKSSAKT